MAVDWQLAHFPFVGGVDTKSDGKVIPPNKLAVLENGVFTKRGQVKKRRGYTALSDDIAAAGGSVAGLSATRNIATVGGELVHFGDSKAHSYVAGTGQWNDRGAIESVVVSLEPVAKVPTEQTLPDHATVGGITVYAWEDSRGSVRYSIVDATTGATWRADVDLGSNTSRPRVVACGGFVHILHAHSSGELRTLVIAPGDPLTANATIGIAFDLNATPVFDADVVGSRIVYAYRSTTPSVRYGLLTPGGSTVAPASTIAFDARAISLCVSADATRIGLVWGDVSDVYLYSLNATTLAMVASTNQPLTDIARVACAYGAGAALRLTAFAESSVVGQKHNHTIASYYLNDAGTTGQWWTNLYRHSHIASKAFRDGSNVYVVTGHDSTIQDSYFVMRYDGLIVARLLPGLAGGVPPKAHLGQVVDQGSNVYAWTATNKLPLDVNVSSPTSTNSAFTEKGIKLATFDFQSAQSHRTVEKDGTLYVTGGILWQFDGQGAVEAGFLLYPEGTTAADGAAGALNGSFSYRVYYEWKNAKGRIERSSCAAAIQHAPTNDKVILTIRTLAHTMKTSTGLQTLLPARGEVAIVVYRTQVNPTDASSFHRVSSLDPSATGDNGYLWNSRSADTVTFTDNMTDTVLITQELDYQNSGELDNIAPEPASIMAEVGDRIVLAGFEDPNLVAYSKLPKAGEAIGFNDALLVSVGEDGGVVTGVGALDEKLIIFKGSRIYALSTAAMLNNVGGGPDVQPTLITTDAGCSDARSIVSVPAGLMFKSAKGIYLLSRSLESVYVGQDVEAYNSQDVVAATLCADVNQVRFLTSDGMTLLFDYYFNQWATWTNHEGVGACLWGSSYTYARGNGTVYQQSQTQYTDDGVPYALTFETAWLHVGGLQQFQRVKSMLLIGEYLSSHSLLWKVAYNYEPAWAYESTFTPASVLNLSTWGSDATWGSGTPWGGSGETVYQFQANLPRQKCQAVKFRFEDVSSDPQGEAYSISELALRVGVKRGPFKLRTGKKASTNGEAAG